MAGRHQDEHDMVMRDAASLVPYPSWDEMMGRIRRDRTEPSTATPEPHECRDWHDLCAEMIDGLPAPSGGGSVR